ncbi:MAG: iron-sulfur cluster assembly protein [Acidobacteriota bacterium]|nr:iron-sulfur cluster assembly protein [Acidobacteriota bacterium]
MTDTDLLNALRDCYDPILKRNIVALGLVRAATLTEDREAPGTNIPGVGPRYIAEVSLFAPSTDEAAIAQLRAQIENRLAGLPAISRTSITLLPAPFTILR